MNGMNICCSIWLLSHLATYHSKLKFHLKVANCSLFEIGQKVIRYLKMSSMSLSSVEYQGADLIKNCGEVLVWKAITQL